MRVSTLIALLVEGEPLTAMLTAGILRDFGYVVLQARTKSEAMAVIAREKNVAVLFTDVDLADGSSGTDLSYQVALQNPNTRIVVTSDRGRPDTLPRGARFVPKPYTDTQLEKAFQV